MWSAITLKTGIWCRRLDERFYLVLALVISALLVGDAFVTKYITGLDDVQYDRLLRYRMSSPVPSQDILIIDIDERSLERVGRDLGRWPWPRQTLAEALATIGEAGARAIYTNVLFSEPDAGNPASDRVLQEIAAASPNMVFSFIRLPEANDAQSQLKAEDIPGARRLVDAPPGGDTVAAIMPVFGALQKNMGAANLSPDDDGIVRAYSYWLAAGSHALPSAAAATLLTAGLPVPPVVGTNPDRLNWRNKQGTYQTVSYAEIYDALQGKGDFSWERVKGKIVIIGPSAPGISVNKATSVSAITDDNTIIATAIDDAMSQTSLKTMPWQVSLVLSLAMVSALALAFMYQVKASKIDATFVGAQSALLAITYLSVSYTSLVVDLAAPFNAGLIFFAVARTFHNTKAASERGVSRFWAHAATDLSEEALLVSARVTSAADRRSMNRVRKALERDLGHNQVLHITDFVAENTFLGGDLSQWELIVAFKPDARELAIDHLIEADGSNKLHVNTVVTRGMNRLDCRNAIWAALIEGPFAAR